MFQDRDIGIVNIPFIFGIQHKVNNVKCAINSDNKISQKILSAPLYLNLVGDYQDSDGDLCFPQANMYVYS